MPDLIAQGTEAQQRWRRTLPEGETIVLGRLGGAWAVPWDRQVSHRHAGLLWNGRALEVVRLPDARNPVFLRGVEVERCAIGPGEHFVIGRTHLHAGRSTGECHGRRARVVQQQSFSSQYLKQVHFRNPDHRIEVLSRLPDVYLGAGGRSGIVRPAGEHVAGRRAQGRRRGRCGGGGSRGEREREGRRGENKVRQGDKERGRQGGEGRKGEKTRKNNLDAASPCLPVSLSPPLLVSLSTLSFLPSPVVLHWDQRLAIAPRFPAEPEFDSIMLRQRQSVLHVWHGMESATPEPYTASDAFDWAFCKAGHFGAMATFGKMLMQGLGGQRDYEAARHWLEQAASADMTEAQSGLGHLYANGLGVPRDATLAAEWFRKAAAANDVPAQVALGTFYLSGIGVAPDPAMAATFFIKAADQKNARAQHSAGLLLLRGDGVLQDVPRAETFLRASAKQNYLPAIISLAEFYSRGEGIAPNLEEAAIWYRKGAEMGDVQCQFIVGRLYARAKAYRRAFRKQPSFFIGRPNRGMTRARSTMPFSCSKEWAFLKTAPPLRSGTRKPPKRTSESRKCSSAGFIWPEKASSVTRNRPPIGLRVQPRLVIQTRKRHSLCFI